MDKINRMTNYIDKMMMIYSVELTVKDMLARNHSLIQTTFFVTEKEKLAITNHFNEVLNHFHEADMNHDDCNDNIMVFPSVRDTHYIYLCIEDDSKQKDCFDDMRDLNEEEEKSLQNGLEKISESTGEQLFEHNGKEMQKLDEFNCVKCGKKVVLMEKSKYNLNDMNRDDVDCMCLDCFMKEVKKLSNQKN